MSAGKAARYTAADVRAALMSRYGGLNALANQARRLVEQIDTVRGPNTENEDA